MTMLDKVVNSLEYLRLEASISITNDLFKEGKLNNKNIDLLFQILNEQVKIKENNSKLYNVKVAGFPFIKSLEEFEFEFQPSLNKEQILNLSESNFFEGGTNIVFIGTPGVGKTHLSIGIGIKVAMRRNAVYFIKFNKLVNKLVNAQKEGKLEYQLKLFNKYRLLIIDEVGFNEVSKFESKLFFQLVDSRYERRSTIYTSNLTFDKWTGIFDNDDMITRAILDRIIHHSYLFNITGNSYRLKYKIIQDDINDKSGDI